MERPRGLTFPSLGVGPSGRAGRLFSGTIPCMNQRNIPKQVRSDYQGLISSRRGTGPLKEWPFGCSVSFRGRNYIVGGFDGHEDDETPTTIRLVDRLCTVELREVAPEELTKTTASPAWSR